MSISSFSAPSASARAAAAVSALMLCTTPSTSGAMVDTTGMRPAPMRSSDRRGVDVVDVADQADVGGHPVDGDAAPHRGEQLGVLTGDPDRVRAVGVDQVHQFATDLAEQHHPRDVEHLRCGDPEAALEIACDAKPFEHRADLRAAAVHHHGVDSAVAQEHHVGGERRLEHVVGHRVAAVFDHDDPAVQLLEPGQRLGENRGLGLRFAGS